jgi:hypothetical protein
MPFGQANASATFQAMMNEVLKEFLERRVVVYIDDVLIYTRTLKEHKYSCISSIKEAQRI